jgi:hypothetical protein
VPNVSRVPHRAADNTRGRDIAVTYGSTGHTDEGRWSFPERPEWL